MREEIKKYKGCLDNKEKAYKECRAWQLKRKVLGIILKNCVNRETETIDFALRSIATSRDYQETEINEQPFAGLKIIEEYELEIIEVQNFDTNLVIILKKKAKEIRLRRKKVIDFYTNRSLGKREDRENMRIG